MAYWKLPAAGKPVPLCGSAAGGAGARKWFISGPDIETVRELLAQEARQYTAGPEGPAILFITRVTA